MKTSQKLSFLLGLNLNSLGGHGGDGISQTEGSCYSVVGSKARGSHVVGSSSRSSNMVGSSSRGGYVVGSSCGSSYVVGSDGRSSSSGNVHVGLSSNLRVDIGHSIDLSVHILLSGDVLMDIGHSSGGQLRVGYGGVIQTGVHSSNRGNSSGDRLGSIGDVVVGSIAVIGTSSVGRVAEPGSSVAVVEGVSVRADSIVNSRRHTSRSCDSKGQYGNEGLHGLLLSF